MQKVTRRATLKGLGLATLLAAGGGGAIAASAHDADPRLLVVYLRGGLDALAALTPEGDTQFYGMRGRDAERYWPGAPSGPALDPFFRLHPALAPLLSFQRAGEMLILPATGVPHVERSHAGAEAHLFSGSIDSRDGGWPGRAARTVSQGTPLVLAAEPRDLATDALVEISLTNPSLGIERLCSDESCTSFGEAMQMLLERRHASRKAAFIAAARSAALELFEPNGPRVALLNLGGVDTHVAQERLLAGTLDALAGGLVAFREAAGAMWDRTVVIVVTEFGRSIRLNDRGGTDHGDASLTLLLGGSVAGGRVAGSWPGLAPGRTSGEDGIGITLDVRSIVKAVLADHLRLSSRAVASVAPEFSSLAAAAGLFKA